MRSVQPNSLRWRLVRRLVGLQACLLALLALLTIGALIWGGFILTLESEDDLIETLQGAVTRNAGGELVLRETPDLAKLRSQTPGLWFIARDRQGQSLASGNVPPEFARIGGALDHVGQARLGWNLGDRPRPTARMKWVDTVAGDVQVVTGPEAQVQLRRFAWAALIVFLSVVLPALAVMALATLVATPLVVRGALAGLGVAAAQAERIDVDQPGTRLPIADVPAEVVPLVKAVNGALGRLDEGHERHKRFLADAAHELRTPIAILQTRLEAQSPGPDNARLLEDVSRLAILTDQLLDLQRLQQSLARFAPVDLVMIARRIAIDLAPLAIAAGYGLSFEPRTESVEVMGDQASLERALTNLVQNAIEHGGRHGTITIAVESSGVIEVSDEGAGIPTGERERIFEPFRRLQPRDRGAGLGLNLVQEVVRLHDGRVTVQDGPNGGARFKMVLPTPFQAAEASPV